MDSPPHHTLHPRLALMTCAALAAVMASPAAETWMAFGDNLAAVSPDCPYVDHGDGSSLPACQASCVANPACNVINAAVSADGGDCVFRQCSHPAAPNLTITQGYSAYGMPARTPLPPGCFPRGMNGGKRRHPPARIEGAFTEPPPASWAPRIASHDMLFTPTDVSLDPRYDLPLLSNGFLGTNIMTDSLFVSGVYNGFSSVTPSHRARIPATVSVPSPGGNVTGAAWDIRRATYYRRASIDPTGTPCTADSPVTCTSSPTRVWVEQRWYAHATLPSLLVMEVEVLTDDGEGTGHPPTTAEPSAVDPPFAVLELLTCPSGISADIAFAAVSVPGQPYTIQQGDTRVAETNTSALQSVAVLSTAWPPNSLLLVPAPGVTHYFLTIVRTSVETAKADLVAALVADWAAAGNMIVAGTLHATHIAEWEEAVRRDV